MMFAQNNANKPRRLCACTHAHTFAQAPWHAHIHALVYTRASTCLCVHTRKHLHTRTHACKLFTAHANSKSCSQWSCSKHIKKTRFNTSELKRPRMCCGLSTCLNQTVAYPTSQSVPLSLALRAPTTQPASCL